MTREEVWLKAFIEHAKIVPATAAGDRADETLTEFDKRFQPVAAFSIAGDGTMTTYSQQELDAMREKYLKQSTVEGK